MSKNAERQYFSQIVYKATAEDGTCLYVGSGQIGREEHLISGKSHCREANEWFYKNKKIIIEIIDRCESIKNARNSEAKFIENLKPLWNKAKIKEKTQKIFLDSPFIGLILIILKNRIKEHKDLSLVDGLIGFYKSSTSSRMQDEWYALRAHATLFLNVYNNVNFMNNEEKDCLLMGVIKRVLLENNKEDVVNNILLRTEKKNSNDDFISMLDMFDDEELSRFNMLIDQLSIIPDSDEWCQLLRSKAINEVKPYMQEISDREILQACHTN